MAISRRVSTIARNAPARQAPDPWAETQAQTALATQFVRDENDYLADRKPDIGRHTGANEHELFVSCDPAQALQQQFEHHRPDFIAVHDVATRSSRKLLAGVAAARGQAVQRLVIRRQGYGTPLARIEFVELGTADGGGLRMYATDTEAGTGAHAGADASARGSAQPSAQPGADPDASAGLAHALLGFARLGVIMVGELPADGAAAALKPLHECMIAGPWPGRHLLLLPLASAAAWASHGLELTRGTGVNVRTTPQVTRPADAWNFIAGTWARLRQQEGQLDAPGAMPALAPFEIGTLSPSGARGAAGTRETARQPERRPVATPPPRPTAPDVSADVSADFDDGDTTQPMPLAMRPMPKVPTEAERATESHGVLERYVLRLAELAGMVSCCVFDIATRRAMAHAGASPGADDLALHGAELLQSISASCRLLRLGHALPEAAITLGGHHLLLRAVPRHPGLALHAVLDKTHANLTLARLQVMRMDALFDDA